MLKYIIILVIGISFVSCKGQKPGSAAPESATSSTKAAISSTDISTKINIDVAEAKTLMKEGKNIVLIDVRTPEEVALGKISDAMEINISSPDFKEKIDILDKNKEYIVYCAAGGRSSTAVSMMKEMGFTKIHNLTPGYTGWSNNK